MHKVLHIENNFAGSNFSLNIYTIIYQCPNFLLYENCLLRNLWYFLLYFSFMVILHNAPTALDICIVLSRFSLSSTEREVAANQDWDVIHDASPDVLHKLRHDGCVMHTRKARFSRLCQPSAAVHRRLCAACTGWKILTESYMDRKKDRQADPLIDLDTQSRLIGVLSTSTDKCECHEFRQNLKYNNK